MTDAHIHIERGPYTIEWINKFVTQAIKKGISHIYLLEHSHRFYEFKDCYDTIIKYSKYQKEWFERKKHISLQSYIDLINKYMKEQSSIRIEWGLEVCFTENIGNVIEKLKLKDQFDFLTGSIHWIDNWGFDHKKEHWENKNIDDIYKLYFKLQRELIESRLFNHVAHPDSIKCFYNYPSYNLENEYYKTAEIAKNKNIKFEQSCGLYNNYAHKSIGLEPKFLEILLKNKIDLVTASDAHQPEDVGKTIKKAKEIIEDNIKKFGLTTASS